jgi:hypothetical protein
MSTQETMQDIRFERRFPDCLRCGFSEKNVFVFYEREMEHLVKEIKKGSVDIY